MNITGLLLLFTFIGIVTWLTIKAFDEFLVFIVFCHSYYTSQLVFDDYESELACLEKQGDGGLEQEREIREKLEQDLDKYYSQVKSCPLKYRFCRFFFYESGFAHTYAVKMKKQHS